MIFITAQHHDAHYSKTHNFHFGFRSSSMSADLLSAYLDVIIHTGNNIYFKID